MKKTNFKLSSLASASLILSLSVATLWINSGHSSETPNALLIKQRSERVFEFDRRSSGVLPSNRVIGLSIALRFGDYRGAEKIVESLEVKMRTH